MAKALIITEKPSVARDIVAALGGFTAKAGGAFWESEHYVVTFAIGHVFSLLEPEDIDPAYKRWSMASLPIVPRRFELKPVEAHKDRISQIRRLIEREDVKALINACDAAREGELIFREIVSYLGTRKWVQRLWLQSMTPEAIRSGFQTLRDGTDLEGLGQAAECRARSDWLIGMNATRAFTERLRLRNEKGSQPWSIGRVQTPTLALLVARELQILEHRPRAYARVVATFNAGSHTYEGVWFDSSFKANPAEPDLKDDRLFDRSKAEGIRALVLGKDGVASETREESQRHAPPLFNLTGLQKYMAQRYKWSSKRTLEAAQRCYEGHKVLTYPRTSSSCLPNDYRGEVRRLLAEFSANREYGEFAAFLQANGLRNEKRTFNDQGVSDHFAIIPTGKSKALSGDDAKVFDAVVRRFLATFYPPAIYDRVKRTTVVERQFFRTGPIDALAIPGWLTVYGREGTGEGEGTAHKSLPSLISGQAKAQGVPVKTPTVVIKEEQTKPPPRINEAALLSLMEHAGRHVENEELASALMSAEGLGTAATRADIIQNLKTKGYVDDTLRPTFKGIHLIATLKRINAARLTSPELTARLELELSEVERGVRTQDTFMDEVVRYTREVVEVARRLDWTEAYPNKDGLGSCPVCKTGQVYERPLSYDCSDLEPRGRPCTFRLPKEVAGRYLDRALAQTLIQGGVAKDVEGFRDAASKPLKTNMALVDGRLVIQRDGRGDEVFVPATSSGDSSISRGSAPPGSKSAGDESHGKVRATAVGVCPMHPSCQVVETKNAFVCESRLKAFAAGETNPVGIMIPKTLCRRPMSLADVSILLQQQRTGELSGFISKAGRSFTAKLELGPDGGCKFVFAKRQGGETYAKKPSRFKPKNTFGQSRYKADSGSGAKPSGARRPKPTKRGLGVKNP